jgi:hypothetical protein
MKKYSKILSLFLVIVLTAGIAFCLRPNDSRRIKKVFYHACSTVSKSADENPVMSAFKMFDFSSLCADSITFTVEGAPFQGTMNNEVLIGELTRNRLLCEKIVIVPLSVTVTIATTNHATAECVVKVQIKGASFDFDEIRHFQVKLQKIDNSWKFTAITDDEVLVR